MTFLVCARFIIPTRKKNVPSDFSETNSKYIAKDSSIAPTYFSL